MSPLWGFLLFLACFYNHFSPSGLVFWFFLSRKRTKKYNCFALGIVFPITHI